MSLVDPTKWFGAWAFNGSAANTVGQFGPIDHNQGGTAPEYSGDAALSSSGGVDGTGCFECAYNPAIQYGAASTFPINDTNPSNIYFEWTVGCHVKFGPKNLSGMTTQFNLLTGSGFVTIVNFSPSTGYVYLMGVPYEFTYIHDEEWHSWIMVYDGTQMRLYRDGVVIFSLDDPGRAMSMLSALFGVYATLTPSSFDNAFVYAGAMSQAAIDALVAGQMPTGDGALNPVPTVSNISGIFSLFNNLKQPLLCDLSRNGVSFQTVLPPGELKFFEGGYDNCSQQVRNWITRGFLTAEFTTFELPQTPPSVNLSDPSKWLGAWNLNTSGMVNTLTGTAGADFITLGTWSWASNFGLDESGGAGKIIPDFGGGIESDGTVQTGVISSFTFSLFAKMSTYAPYSYGLSIEISANGQILVANPTFLFNLDIHGTQLSTTDWTLLDDQWHNYAIQYNSVNGQYRILRDGVVFASGTISAGLSTSAPWPVFTRIQDGGNVNPIVIDNITFTGEYLSDAAIAALAAGRMPDAQGNLYA